MYMYFIWVIFQLSHSFYQYSYRFFHNNHSWTIQQYFFCLCCWHIWMHKTLFQTWHWPLPPLPKEIILDSMIVLSMWVNFNSYNQISNVQLFSLLDLNFQLCPSTSLRWNLLISFRISKPPFTFHLLIIKWSHFYPLFH